MPVYRITTPTLALCGEADQRVARPVPAGATVLVDAEISDHNGLIEVSWEGQLVLMFARDLRMLAARED
jgi:hypothetical protein